MENFPTLLVQAGRLDALFYGPMLPHIGHLERLLASLRAGQRPAVAPGCRTCARLLTANRTVPAPRPTKGLGVRKACGRRPAATASGRLGATPRAGGRVGSPGVGRCGAGLLGS